MARLAGKVLVPNLMTFKNAGCYYLEDVNFNKTQTRSLEVHFFFFGVSNGAKLMTGNKVTSKMGKTKR